MPGDVQFSTSEDAFANLLASLANKTSAPDEWDASALADDIATISCKQLPSAQAASPLQGGEERPAAAIPSDSAHVTGPKASKTAGITIRLTQAERAQLRQRAAEAHLTVSDYLRSCIFEAESLRAQVKEALLQMRAATQHQPSVSSDGRGSRTQRGRFRFLSR
jgi:hypothetical protein